MCTVTLIARRHGYALGMNRDEQLTRVAALPPALRRIGKHHALFPCEPNGGTWIGVNDSGITLALINWYSIAERVRTQPVSRGVIVKSALVAESLEGLNECLDTQPLAHVNPFRLIGVFPAAQKVVEWRWNLRRLERHDHPWKTNIWISSGYDEPGAQQTRGKTFRAALTQSSAGRLDWLRRFHRSHPPERGPYSVCMHRTDAATVSYAEVVVTERRATMRYATGPPCGQPLSAVQNEGWCPNRELPLSRAAIQPRRST